MPPAQNVTGLGAEDVDVIVTAWLVPIAAGIPPLYRYQAAGALRDAALRFEIDTRPFDITDGEVVGRHGKAGRTFRQALSVWCPMLVRSPIRTTRFPAV